MTTVLIDAIRRKAADDIDALWHKAQSDVESYRDGLAREEDAQRAAAARTLASKTAAYACAADAEAQATARKTVAIAKAALAERLHTLAVAALPGLGETISLAALAAELPPRAWQRIQVGPEDRAAAQELFPRAEIVGDPAIAGGLDVEEGEVRVSNTLEARLESAWPEILPSLMHEVLDAASDS